MKTIIQILLFVCMILFSGIAFASANVVKMADAASKKLEQDQVETAVEVEIDVATDLCVCHEEVAATPAPTLTSPESGEVPSSTAHVSENISVTKGIDQELLDNVTLQDVVEAEELWSQGVLRIGDAYRTRKDFRSIAARFVSERYAFGLAPTQFVPTKAKEQSVRINFDEASSYFIGGIVESDTGFALKRWEKIWFEEQEVALNGKSARASGVYVFTTDDGQVFRARFTFDLIKFKSDGIVRAVLHHSSELPT